MTVARSEFDAKSNLLNLQNGTLDLDTMEFRERHDSYDYLGKIANVSYDPDARCNEWESFLGESLAGDCETIAFLQDVLGLALMCDTSTECMFILLGKTRSGKSTTVETIQKMLNPEDDGYACASNPETFATKCFDDASRPSSDIARLAGKRFVVTSEPPKSMLLNVARLKQLTERDMITARSLHENEIQFYSQFTLVMTANNAPRVNDVNTVRVEPRLRDSLQLLPRSEGARPGPERAARAARKSLGNSELVPGRLARFKKEGLQPSGLVTLATADYQAKSDKIHCFMGECMTTSDDAVTGADAYEAYQDWCRSSGYQAEGEQTFFNGLRERGILQERGTVNGQTRRNVIPNCSLLRGGCYA